MLRKLKILLLIILLLIILVFGLLKTSLKKKHKYLKELLVSGSLGSYSSLAEDTIIKDDILFVMGTNTISHGSDSASTSRPISPYTVLNQGNGILFVETTEKRNPSSLVLCAIESAARVYPDRPVAFFIKGLNDITTEEEENRTRISFPTLSSYKNIYFFPLRMEELFMYTPLITWYKRVLPRWERFWTHVSSDACRFAMMWKYGGIYMDTDVISLHPVPTNNFIAAESFKFTSSSVFGLSPFHSLTWEFMQNFVENYRGNYWGYQGPRLFTRVMRRLCGNLKFKSVDDNVTCGNVSYLHPERFYPIVSSSWKIYFKVWQNLPTFNKSYGLHFWNYRNNEQETMVPGSNTLVEHLYQQHCPSTYGSILKKKVPSGV